MIETQHIEYKSGNKNIFEDIIDDLMLENYSNEPELTDFIKSLPNSDKRMAILSLLDSDNNMWLKLKSLIGDENLSKVEQIKDVVLMLREYVKIAEVEKKKFGEVMTPLDLVKEMLATLPKEVWSNPNLKWLDPANGTGPFPIMVIYKLMKGLEQWEPNEELRYKHIIENMIYACELQPKNMFLYLCAIDPKDEFECNVYTGSFLDKEFDKHMKEIWNIDKFDIILGNPPYQMDSGNVGAGHTLWNRFVIKSFNILSKNGFLTMVHPGGWRNVSGSFDKVKQEIMNRDILYLEIHNLNDGIKTFGAATRYDFYCIRNSNSNIESKVKDEDGNIFSINLKNFKFIPNKHFFKFKDLTEHNNKKVDLVYSRSMYGADKKHVVKEMSDIYRYPCVKYISKKDYSIDFRYTDSDRGMFGIPKVMFGLGSQVGGITIDENGSYGLCQFLAGISDEVENLPNIKKALESEDFKEIMRACQFTTQAYNYKIISLFRKDFWKEFV